MFELVWNGSTHVVPFTAARPPHPLVVEGNNGRQCISAEGETSSQPQHMVNFIYVSFDWIELQSLTWKSIIIATKVGLNLLTPYMPSNPKPVISKSRVLAEL